MHNTTRGYGSEHKNVEREDGGRKYGRKVGERKEGGGRGWRKDKNER